MASNPTAKPGASRNPAPKAGAAGKPAQKSGAPGKPAPVHVQRIMRIGIIQGGRIVEERLVRKHENITIGQSSKNLFVVPSEALPRMWLLFAATAKGYVAQFADGMDARIAVGQEIISLSQLKQTGKLAKTGNSYLLPLDERSRGKISVGDLTILFQFVTPPPPQPRPQLPASVRGSLASNLDWFFTSVAAGSFVLHLCLVAYLRSVDWPRKPDIENIPDRFVQMVVKKPEPEPEPEKKAEEKKPEKVVKKEVVVKKEEAPAKKELTEEEKKKIAEDKAKADAERKARIAEQVKNTGILKLLAANTGEDGAVADVLGRGDVDRDQEKAFEGVSSVAVATSNANLHGVKGAGTSGRVASIGSLRGSGDIAGASTGSVGSEKKVTAVVKDQAPSVDGELDPGVVAKEVKRRLGAVKACYERALKRNPALSGKLVLYWTITPEGTVSKVDIEQDTMGDSEVGNCIKTLVKSWRFPRPSGGQVDVSFPFVFQASS